MAATTALAIGAAAAVAPAQSAAHPPANGMRAADLRAHALTGATVVTAPGERLEKATIVVRDGLIDAVGVDIAIPPDARLWPADDLVIYAGFIDAALLIDAEELPESGGRHANPSIRAERRMATQPAVPEAPRTALRTLGFTTAAVYPSRGILRGDGAVILLGDEPRILVERSFASAGFDRTGGGYPGSLMGSIALLRQTLADAAWYRDALLAWSEHPDRNAPPAPQESLAALSNVIRGAHTVLFDAADELNALRAGAIAREFGLRFAVLGSGTEFRRLSEITALGAPFILPLQYPEAPNVASVHGAESVSLRDLQTWEQAPTNPRRLKEAGVEFALTSQRLRNRADFHRNLRDAVRHGLTEDDALAAVTTTPARMLGIDRLTGMIAPGMIANLVVMEQGLFAENGKVRDLWIAGRRFEINRPSPPAITVAGVLRTDLGHALPFRLDTGKSSAEIRRSAEERRTVKAKSVTRKGEVVELLIDAAPFHRAGSAPLPGYVRLTGTWAADRLAGTGIMPNGVRFTFDVEPGPFEAGPEDADADAAPAERGAGRRRGRDRGDSAAPTAPADAPAPRPDDGISGTWNLLARMEMLPDPLPITLELVRNADGSISGTATAMENPAEISGGTFDPATGALHLAFTGGTGMATTLTGTARNNRFEGTSTAGRFTATLTGERMGSADDGDPGASPAAKDDAFEPPPDHLPLPLGAYGVSAPPGAGFVLFRGATLWTAGPDGIIRGGDLLIQDGRIAYVGPARTWTFPGGTGPEVIDAAGLHITPGLIDCHSHTGISGGVNEGTQANTAEVRIGDVINPDDVNWYRQLAGGLTAANQLHGSANPIGGQNSVVKLRWGGTLESMRIPDAKPGIKFALGENVTRSTTRYPNTRMGVETFIRDAFTAAAEYDAARTRYAALPPGERARRTPPPVDHELDALVEILRGERIIHCHSYRQDEILMLIRLADDFGFRIGTFQHVLEGFKVAEAIAAHGAGASSFSDWWAYKVEVMDAIPHNGTLLARVGANVSFNSDSNELARRMNTEAAKAVRYGGLDPHEALRFVTINPAWQLGIDHRTGSLEVGKDADLAVWSADPLSTYARCLQTWVDGARLFDHEEDRRMQADAAAERDRLIQKVLARAHGRPQTPQDGETGTDGGADAPESPDDALWAHLDDDARRWMEEQVRLGRDPLACMPGDCGCAWPVFGMRP